MFLYKSLPVEGKLKLKNFIRELYIKLFRRNKPTDTNNIKKYSTTLTTAKEGSDSKRDLNSEIRDIVDNLKRNGDITNEALNKISSFYFNAPEIPNSFYRLNPSLAKGMAFRISEVKPEIAFGNDIVSLEITLRENVYNADVRITVSVKDFHEFLQEVKC